MNSTSVCGLKPVFAQLNSLICKIMKCSQKNVMFLGSVDRNLKKKRVWLNMSYLTDSYIVFTLKMKSVSKIKIFGLKMVVKSGLEKIFLKFLHAEAIFF